MPIPPHAHIKYSIIDLSIGKNREYRVKVESIIPQRVTELESATNSLEGYCSTIELHPHLVSHITWFLMSFFCVRLQPC